MSLIALLSLALTAQAAVPAEMNHSGRLLDSAGVPLDGTFPLTFRLYTAPSGGTDVWNSTESVDFDNGYYNVTLGDSGLTEDLFMDDIYLSLAVDGGAELSDRLHLVTVPYAFVANSVDGGLVDASEVQVDGTTVIDATGQMVAPGSLGGLACSSGQIAVYGGSSWSCGAAMDEATVEGFIENGSINLDATSTIGTLSFADHVTLTSIDLAAGSMMDGDVLSTGPHAGGTLPVDTGDPAACDGMTAGNMYYNTSSEQIFACNGTAWTPIGPSGTDPGQVSGDGQTSCEAIKTAQPSSVSGVFWLDPAQTGSSFEAYCEMSISGGGWELAMNLDTSDGNVRYYKDTSWWTGSGDFGSTSGPFGSDYKSGDIFTTPRQELLIVVHQAGSVVGWRSWDLASEAPLQAFFLHDLSRNSPAWLTGASTNSNVGPIDSRDSIVKPGNRLYANVVWGSTGSYDWSRVRNANMTGTDNTDWGMGVQMDAQNNNGDPWYPGCDVGSRTPWSNWFCVGNDKVCNTPQCGSASGGTKDLAYDYAIYVRGEVAVGDSTASLVGNSSATAGADCQDILDQRSDAPSGPYWIDPSGSSPFQTACDMDTNGGGWSLMMNLDTSDGNVRYYRDDTWWTGSGNFGSADNAYGNDFKAGGVLTANWDEIMIRVHHENLDTMGWRSWSLPSGTNMQSKFNGAKSRSANVLTTGSTGSDVSGLPSADVVVRPGGNLHFNMEWGATGSYDLARLRADSIGSTDNVNWGMGMQMDAQNNGQLPWYPGCDVGSNVAWSSWFCIGEDKQCNSPQCGSTSGSSQYESMDYAVYMR